MTRSVDPASHEAIDLASGLRFSGYATSVMADPLTFEEGEQLSAALVELKASLEAQLVAFAEGVRPVDLDEPIGRLSRMDAMQQQKMAEASRRAVRQRFDRVLAAIASHSRNEYGDCLHCEEPIGYKRLRARPEAALCLICKTAKEKRR